MSKAGTGDEATAAKEALVRDGINIEVHTPFTQSGSQAQAIELLIPVQIDSAQAN